MRNIQLSIDLRRSSA